MPHSYLHPEPCQPADFKATAVQLMLPTWLSTNASVPNLYNVFLPNMVSGYNDFGCQWFTGRIAAWTAQYAGLNNQQAGGVIGQRLHAKIVWAQEMHIICACLDSPIPLVGNLSSAKIIQNFILDLSDLSAAAETRSFTVSGTNGSAFSLEIKNEDNYYYNFTTNLFQVAKARLDNKTIVSSSYSGSITFPSTITTDTVNGAVTSGVKVVMDAVVASTMKVGDRVTGNAALNAAIVTVAALNPDGDNTSEFSLSTAIAIGDGVTLSFASDDKYDIYLFADYGTKHAEYKEVRFGDDSIDINSSIGSNSLLMQKVIYKYAPLTLTMSTYNPTAAFTISSLVNDTLDISRGKNRNKIPFTISCSSSSGASFQIIRQPTSNDILSFAEPTISSAPETLPGENIYPAISDTDTIDGAVANASKVVMDTNVADKMAVGDKITTAVTTDTVDGAVTSGIKVVMDNNVAVKMSIGDQITGNAYLDANIVTVAALDPDGDNAKEFSMSEAVALSDGITLTFSSLLNRSLTTVVALNPDGDNVKEFSISQAHYLMDGITLSFSNQMNYQWPIDSIDKITEGMIVVTSTNVTAGTKVGKYEDTVTVFANTDQEEVIIKNQAPALSTKSQKPTVVKGLVTVQPGNVIFNNQQVLALADDVLKVGGYGMSQILNVFGWEVEFSDLAIALTSITTTTTAASQNSTSVVLAARDGILNAVSTVSGIGINPAATAPTVASGASAAGAGTVVLSAAQTLENGITLTFPGAGKVATITGNIKVIKAGVGSPVLRFDVEKLLTSA